MSTKPLAMNHLFEVLRAVIAQRFGGVVDRHAEHRPRSGQHAAGDPVLQGYAGYARAGAAT